MGQCSMQGSWKADEKKVKFKYDKDSFVLKSAFLSQSELKAGSDDFIKEFLSDGDSEMLSIEKLNSTTMVLKDEDGETMTFDRLKR